MDPETLGTQKIRFGLYEFDSASGQVFRQGQRVRLQEQPLRILHLLLQKPGEIVTREELRQALWPAGTHVNFDGSLNAALKKLRAAIQDEADNPRFIETVPRQGYRFLAPVQVENPPSQIPEEILVEEPLAVSDQFEVRLRMQPEFSPERTAELQKERQKQDRARRWVDSTVLTCAILFGSWFLFFIVYPVPRPTVQRMTRITNAGDIDEWGGIVSDGARIFFLGRSSGVWHLMQTSVEGGNAEAMAAPFKNTRVFAISPNHSQFLIGEFNRRDDEMPLWLWPVQGGAPRRLGEAVGHDPAWSPDGSRIVFVRGRSLFMIRPDGTQLQEIAHPNGWPHAPGWSSDGSLIRFTLDRRENNAASVWEMTAEGTGLHPLLAAATQPSSQSGGQWTADGKYFLFSGCQNNECNLWAIRDAWNWLRRAHHDPVQLTTGPDSLHVSIPAQAGSRVFAFSMRAHRELQKIDAANGRSDPLIVNSYAEDAVVSPDGQQVLYTDKPDGSLWRSRTDGTQRLRLTKWPLVASEPRWSRDGKNILFTAARPDGPRQIFLLSKDGGALRSVLPQGREATSADWSADGSQIVVCMREQKSQAKFGIYLFKPGTGEWTLLPESRGLKEPQWSPDGRYIAALDDSNQHLLLYDFQKLQWTQVAEGKLLGMPYWPQTGEAIYFQDQLHEEEAIFKVSIQNNRVEKVYGFGDMLGASTHYLFGGLDSQGALYVTVERGLTDIYALDLDLP